MSATLAEAERSDDQAARAEHVGIAAVARSFWHFFVSQSFSSLTRRIVFLNVAGLFALVIGILWLSQFRAGLIDARAQSLTVQGEIIAAAVAASATVETNTLTFNPKDLSDLPYDDSQSALEFSINPESVARVLRQLVSPTKTRARIYDGDGELLLDSRTFYRRG